MTDKPFLDESRLRKALAAQGFSINNTTNGVRVLAPDGVSTSGWHPSVFKGSGANRNYRNQLAQLVRIGFNLDAIEAPNNGDDDVWRRERRLIETMISEQERQAFEEKQREDRARREKADRHETVSRLGPNMRAVYDAIIAEPGKQPREYQSAVETYNELIYAGKVLRLKGLIYTSGSRRSARWWPTDMAPELVSKTPVPRVTKTTDIERRIDELSQMLKDIVRSNEELANSVAEYKSLFERVRKLLPE